ncbi:putative ubiquitin-conjugating enzyme [Rosellinia necatrix]|uniref:Putative ubiquitin-conjugating enzyme n=1 Tax=Rosellinia necatrix TaxID=77044 RepID=A0A1S7UJQ3_ROSNE|nr:putative ubiquitin-conjugating enzyme [Rosellinia necatrix]
MSAEFPRSAAKRLLRELTVWKGESAGEAGIERLGPVNDEELLRWEAVINGQGIGGGYDSGRWLLSIDVPPTYPLAPPRMTFRTEIVHANVALGSGEICLDLLKEAWTPAYSVLECVRAVRLLLAYPGVDSPLNVDAAALLRAGDTLAARRLTEYWCSLDKGRYDGP